MIKAIRQWWGDRALAIALQQRNFKQVQGLIDHQRRTGLGDSPLARLCQDFLAQQAQLQQLQRQFKQLQRQSAAPAAHYFAPDRDRSQTLAQQLQLRAIDQGLLQSMGLPESIFSDLETILVNYLDQRLSPLPASGRSQLDLQHHLKAALRDLWQLKKGQSPAYDLPYSPEAYCLEYFLENVLCLFISWFLIYQHHQLPIAPKILDLAAGPATTLLGLLLFRESLGSMAKALEQPLIYCAIDSQPALQHLGQDLIRTWLAETAIQEQSYLQFKTLDLTADCVAALQPQFFDWITIAHCFPWDAIERAILLKGYHDIINRCLSEQGHVLLIIQDKKFHHCTGLRGHQLTDDREKQAIITFLAPLKLELVWYSYLNSTGQRSPLGKQGFRDFATQNLPPQRSITQLWRKYLGSAYERRYCLDDYVIVARPMRH